MKLPETSALPTTGKKGGKRKNAGLPTWKIRRKPRFYSQKPLICPFWEKASMENHFEFWALKGPKPAWILTKMGWTSKMSTPDGCGGRIWTYDLRVMSPTSYRTAPPRDIFISQVLNYYTTAKRKKQVFFEKNLKIRKVLYFVWKRGKGGRTHGRFIRLCLCARG